MILLKFSLINKWRENQNNLYVMKNFILLIHQLFHLTSCALYWLQVCIDLANWTALNKVKVKVAQSCPTLWDPMEYTVHGILLARMLECVAFTFPGVLPNPGIELRSPALQADSLTSEPPGTPWFLNPLLNPRRKLFLFQPLNYWLGKSLRACNNMQSFI